MENLLHFWQKMKWPTYSPCYSRIISIEMFKMIKKNHFWKDTTEAWAVNSNLGFCHFCTYWQPQKRISWTSTSGSTSIPVYTGSRYIPVVIHQILQHQDQVLRLFIDIKMRHCRIIRFRFIVWIIFQNSEKSHCKYRLIIKTSLDILMNFQRR